MNRVRIIDHFPTFARSAKASLNNALREGARDGLIDAKEHAPYADGGLRGSTDLNMIRLMVWRISFGIEYARFQEFGGDSKRKVRNYSHSGTGAHYLRNAGDKQFAKLILKFKKHSGA